jgi:hypothetical protein
MTNRILLMSVMLLATSGCASSPAGANLEVQLAVANRQIADLQILRASEQRLLSSQLNECRARSAQERRDGFVASQYNVLNSIEVAGVPRVVSGWFSDDFYYRFELRVNGRRFAFVEVQTSRKENALGSLLAKIGDITKVVTTAADAQ